MGGGRGWVRTGPCVGGFAGGGAARGGGRGGEPVVGFGAGRGRLTGDADERGDPSPAGEAPGCVLCVANAVRTFAWAFGGWRPSDERDVLGALSADAGVVAAGGLATGGRLGGGCVGTLPAVVRGAAAGTLAVARGGLRGGPHLDGLGGSHVDCGHADGLAGAPHTPHGGSVMGEGVFYRKDDVAWKPGGLHRSRWSRRPWDFHAIAPLKGRSKEEETDQARNGGRRSRSAAKPQSDRWSPKRFAPHLASLRWSR